MNLDAVQARLNKRFGHRKEKSKYMNRQINGFEILLKSVKLRIKAKKLEQGNG